MAAQSAAPPHEGLNRRIVDVFGHQGDPDGPGMSRAGRQTLHQPGSLLGQGHLRLHGSRHDHGQPGAHLGCPVQQPEGAFGGLPERARGNDQVRLEDIADQRQAGFGGHPLKLPGRAVLPVGVHELQAVGAERAADRDHFLQGEESGLGPGIEIAVPQDPVEVVVDQQNAGGHGGRSRSPCRPGDRLCRLSPCGGLRRSRSPTCRGCSPAASSRRPPSGSGR